MEMATVFLHILQHNSHRYIPFADADLRLHVEGTQQRTAAAHCLGDPKGDVHPEVQILGTDLPRLLVFEIGRV